MARSDRSHTRSSQPGAGQASAKRTTPLAAALFALALLLGLGVLPRLFGAKSALVGHPAPDFSLEVVHNGEPGARIHLSEMQGHPVLLDFWATWCGPCQMQAPVLEKTFQKWRAQGVVIVGIDTSDEPNMAPAFARRRGLSYPIAYDAGEHVAATYRVESLPTMVVIDTKGNISAVRTGFEDESELEELIRAAM